MTIDFKDLSFSYRRKRQVFSGLDLRIAEFPAVLLGPNGAGKSTLMGLVSGTLRPDAGAVEIEGGGSELSARDRRAVVGWLPQDVRPIAGLRVREQVAYSGWLQGMTSAKAWEASLPALERVGLDPEAKASSNGLSGGQRRRMGIAQSLISSPRLLILDEPYAGLDPEQRSDIRIVLQELAASTDLLVSTHQTEDLEDIYRHVVVLQSGRVQFGGSVEDFLSYAPEGVPIALRAEQAYRTLMTAGKAASAA